MTAGLPGIAVGGIFFVLSALAMPFFELFRAATGRSSRTSWRAVTRNATIALAITLSVERVAWFGFLVKHVAEPGGGESPVAAARAAGFDFPVLPVMITATCLAAVLLVAYGLLVLRGRGPDGAALLADDCAEREAA